MDGAQVPSTRYSSDDNSWYGYDNGPVDSTFEAAAEATDGGAITSLYASVYSRVNIGSQYSAQTSWVANTWTQDVAISAPIPEPETYAMLLAGLGLIGTVARRRRNAAK